MKYEGPRTKDQVRAFLRVTGEGRPRRPRKHCRHGQWHRCQQCHQPSKGFILARSFPLAPFSLPKSRPHIRGNALTTQHVRRTRSSHTSPAWKQGFGGSLSASRCDPTGKAARRMKILSRRSVSNAWARRHLASRRERWCYRRRRRNIAPARPSAIRGIWFSVARYSKSLGPANRHLSRTVPFGSPGIQRTRPFAGGCCAARRCSL